jgi:hypothetical protein
MSPSSSDPQPQTCAKFKDSAPRIYVNHISYLQRAEIRGESRIAGRGGHRTATVFNGYRFCSGGSGMLGPANLPPKEPAS